MKQIKLMVELKTSNRREISNSKKKGGGIGLMDNIVPRGD